MIDWDKENSLLQTLTKQATQKFIQLIKVHFYIKQCMNNSEEILLKMSYQIKEEKIKINRL